MPRSNWKGVISFGLVSIPVELFPAENKAADITFHQIDKRNKARIKYQRVNVETGKTVPWEQITRGYEYDKDTTIPIPDEVLKRVAGENARTISIETFIDKKDLNYIAIRNSYYVAPDKGGEKGYVILREALKSTHKIGIAKVIISTKEYLSALIPYEDGIVLCLLKYYEEMRQISELELPKKELSAYKINKKEMDMAKKLIKSMSSKWRPEKYIDDYQKAIHKWVEESVRNLPHSMMKQKKHAPKNMVNFIDLLKKSLATKDNHKKKYKTIINSKKIPHKHVTRH